MEGKIIEKKVNRKRPITYSFRVSEQERKIIDEKIKSSGFNRTEFLIRALRNKPVTVIGQGGELLTELKRQGNNLNQALRNSYLKPGEKQETKTQEEIRKTEKEMEQLRENIRFESGVRKFLLWLTPALLVVQTIVLAISLL